MVVVVYERERQDNNKERRGEEYPRALKKVCPPPPPLDLPTHPLPLLSKRGGGVRGWVCGWRSSVRWRMEEGEENDHRHTRNTSLTFFSSLISAKWRSEPLSFFFEVVVNCVGWVHAVHNAGFSKPPPLCVIKSFVLE